MRALSENAWERVPRLYFGSARTGYRDAVRPTCRAVVTLPGGMLLMTTTDEYGELVFPGGGAEGDEDALATLVREVAEETGYTVDLESCEPLAYVEEVRTRDDLSLNMTMVSRYFLCTATKTGAPAPDEREALTGLRPAAVTLSEALETNGRLLDQKRLFWVARDQLILEMLRSSSQYRAWLGERGWSRA